MRRAVLGLVLLAATGCASSGTDPSNGPAVTDDSVQCEAERHAIERDKAAAGQAQAAGDEATASQKRQDVGLAAHIARGLAGCDISDLVGPSVGQ